MDQPGRGRFLAASLLAVLIGTGIAVVAYNAGVHHAAMMDGKAFAPPPNAQVVYVRPWGYGHGYGFGFFPILFIFFGFFLLRSLFWGRHWRGYGGYYRCMHGQQPENPQQQQQPPPSNM